LFFAIAGASFNAAVLTNIGRNMAARRYSVFEGGRRERRVSQKA
jgi:hypothetical protein